MSITQNDSQIKRNTRIPFNWVKAEKIYNMKMANPLMSNDAIGKTFNPSITRERVGQILKAYFKKTQGKKFCREVGK